MPPADSPGPAVPLWEAVALGLLHGPAELVPVSSSGHIAALPWLLRWPSARASGTARKELEVPEPESV